MRVTPYLFRCACDGLVRDIRDACAIEWVAYRGHLSDIAWFQARIVMRMARELGLYPTTAQLERETREAA